MRCWRPASLAALVGSLTVTSPDASGGPDGPPPRALAPMKIQQAEVIRPLPLAGAGRRLPDHRTVRRHRQHWSSIHTGLDFAVGYGTPIHAITSGVVTEAAYDGSYGNKTVVTLEDGTEIWYCHQDTLAVSAGQRVATGEVIGAVGMTGNTTGPHVHVEVRPGGGDPVDPAAVLEAT